MLVKATKIGFYKGARQRVGQVFEMGSVRTKEGKVVDGKGRAISWVVPADGEGVSGPKVLGPNESSRNPVQTKSGDGSGDQNGEQ